MEAQFLYFDVAHAIKIHDWIIEHSGGMSGKNNIALLESPLEHIRNDLYYPKIEDKTTHLVYSVNKNHTFMDGNKRLSIVLGAYFLELNGYGYCVEIFLQRMENITIWIATNVISKILLLEIITSIIYEVDYSEALKLKIISAVSKQDASF